MVVGAYGVLPEAWAGVCVEMGFPKYRGAQIAQALYRAQIGAWAEASTLPKDLTARLEAEYPVGVLETAAVEDAGENVRKLALRALDGEITESVIIPQNERVTVCVSSQVGCNFKCVFCASGQLGCKRSLSAAEIVAQVLTACRLLRDEARAAGIVKPPAGGVWRPNNIVVMGMGEPFDNYDEVLKALRILNAPQGVYIGARHMTISTCGVVPGILRLAEEGVQFELSVSLHAPTDELRSRIMPVNKRWPIAELMEACKAYMARTGRIVTFEYTLVRDLNDGPREAQQLAALLRGTGARVNLIPLSPVKEFDGKAPDEGACRAFQSALLGAGVNTTLRRSRGREGAAACGQLRRRMVEADRKEV